ncbi:hypothetical protein [Actinacidiphila sp. ITFR-21]|uniref:hypothetical protein n=1 Tax=Actinacidiphila sp. ITFR-21 TaxID=3075199 RepID=UPI00288A57C6|nr:hypothetical protein [Streptomyces sp. ITFR-21]WNI15536.1 hypothetical protein RLT57_08370 [Streptomyces sp. ITFR-21]
MTEVRVRAVHLDEGCPVVLRDTVNVYDLAIDFTASPEDITAALAAVWQEAVDSGRWTRRKGNAGPS